MDAERSPRGRHRTTRFDRQVSPGGWADREIAKRSERGAMRAAFVMIAALMLGGCSSGAGVFDTPARQAFADDTPESYYKFLVANHPTTKTLRSEARMAPLQVSGLRQAVAPQPGDWMTCLRAWNLGKGETFYAVFIRNREIIEFRSGIGIDRCEGEQFSPLPDIYVPPREPRPGQKTP